MKFFVQPDGNVVLLPKLTAQGLRGIVMARETPVTLEQMDEAIADGAAATPLAGE